MTKQTEQRKDFVWLQEKNGKLVDRKGQEVKAEAVEIPVQGIVLQYRDRNEYGQIGEVQDTYRLGFRPSRDILEKANSYRVTKVNGDYFEQPKDCYNCRALVQFYKGDFSGYSESKLSDVCGTRMSIRPKLSCSLEELVLSEDGTLKLGDQIVTPKRVKPVIVSLNSFELGELYPDETELDLLKQKIDKGSCEGSKKPSWANAFALGNPIHVMELGPSKKYPIVYVEK